MTGESVWESLCALLRSHSPELREGTVSLRLDSQLADIGIDSLQLLSLAVDVENEFDTSIDDTALASARTVSDLVQVIVAAKQQIAE